MFRLNPFSRARPEVDEYGEPTPGGEGFRSALGTIGLILLAPILALIISAFMFQSYQVEGESMENTLQNGDRLIVNKLPKTLARISHNSYIPKRGDIVIFDQSGVQYGFKEPRQLIKRVIGLPDERVVIKDGSITVYNQEHPGGFDPDLSGQYQVASGTTPGNVDVTLKGTEIFVCGDNRSNSEDSRYFGPVDSSKLVGKLSVRIFPLGQPHRP